MSYLEVQRLHRIQEEFTAVNAALTYAEHEWPKVHRQDPFAVRSVQYAEMQRALNNIEDTYIIRAFSEFEGLLRDHLRLVRPPVRVPHTAEGLINRVALRVKILNQSRDDAHNIRVYRNGVVHQNITVFQAVTFRQALAFLNRFLSAIP